MPKVYMDSMSAAHVTQRIKERIPKPADQAKMVSTIKKLLTLEAPAEAVGQYQWHINVSGIGRIVLRGHTVRTVYSLNESFPNSPEYKMQSGGLVRA